MWRRRRHSAQFSLLTYVPSKDPASPKDINDNSYTTFNISPKGENVIDLYNTNLLFTYKGTYKLTTKVDLQLLLLL